MCGIFGIISTKSVDKEKLKKLVEHSRQRGRDSSGIIQLRKKQYRIDRADFDIIKLVSKVKPYKSNVVLGHSRLITNGLGDNQPVVRGNIAAIHNTVLS